MSSSLESLTNNVIEWPAPEGKTFRFVTLMEKVALMGKRARQIEEGSTPTTYIGDLTLSDEIAQAEWDAGMFPIDLVRKAPDGTTETLNVADLALIR
jgi:DNA-directed RNA polymerase subunit K/omega